MKIYYYGLVMGVCWLSGCVGVDRLEGLRKGGLKGVAD